MTREQGQETGVTSEGDNNLKYIPPTHREWGPISDGERLHILHPETDHRKTSQDDYSMPGQDYL